MTNIFYLINAILQSFPSISTNTPLASILPLVFVVVLGMIRELVDDLKRWKSDRRTNKRKFTKVISKDMTKRVTVRSDQLKVGDILELHDE